jgi:phage-related protein
MEFTEFYFTYDGISSRKYNLWMVNVETSPIRKMNGPIKSNTIFNKGGNKSFFVDESFEDSLLTFEAEIVSDNAMPIPVHVRRDVEKWLFHKDGYRKLYMDFECDPYGEIFELENGSVRRSYLNCRLVNPERLEYNGGVVGYKFTIECDSCMAWQDPTTFSFELDNPVPSSRSVVEVTVDTDVSGYVYPKVTIEMRPEGGGLAIRNKTDDMNRATAFTSLSPSEIFVMVGDGLNYISGDNFTKFTNMNFVRLVNGVNEIEIAGRVRKITFEFQNQRYL